MMTMSAFSIIRSTYWNLIVVELIHPEGNFSSMKGYDCHAIQSTMEFDYDSRCKEFNLHEGGALY